MVVKASGVAETGANAALRRQSSGSIDMKHNLAAVRPRTVFEQIETLPCAQHHRTVRHWNAQTRLRQGGLYVSWHVIRPLRCVPQPAHAGVVARWYQAVKEIVQIHLNIRVGVLLDQQRTGRMAHVDGE